MGGLRQATVRRTGERLEVPRPLYPPSGYLQAVACLKSLDNDRVTFPVAGLQGHGNQTKSMTLDAVEFIRRFLFHILPSGFVKIRHFGFLANRNRSHALAICRQHLRAVDPPPTPIAVLAPQQKQAMERRCPMCQRGTLRLLACLSVQEPAAYLVLHPINSS